MQYEHPDVEQIFNQLNGQIAKSAEFMKNELANMRAGRANARLMDKIVVDYYGAPTPLPQVANISNPEARLLVISVYDKSLLGKVERAILAANIGITPNNDGSVIRLIFPELNAERRQELSKQVRKISEESKVAIRNERRNAMEGLKKAQNSKLISEDMQKTYEKEVDKLIAKAIEAIEAQEKAKVAEILSV